MVSTWSNAELRLMATGENDNTWGSQTNDNIQRIDDMVNAYIGVTLSGTTKTLDFTNDPTSYAQEDGRCKILNFTGSPGGTCTVTFPNKLMWYYILNNTGDSNSIICTAGTGAATYTVQAGRDSIIYVDGSDEIYNALNDLQTTTLKVDTISETTAAGGVTIDGTQLKDTKVFTDQVDPKSGTNLTLGTTGDSVLIPSGVTIANSGTATGFGSLVWQSVQTGTITGAAGKAYPVNTTSGAITLNLPAGVVGEQVAVVDYAGTFDTNALTISANSSEKIKGSTADVIMETERQAGVLTYVDATQGWVLTSAAPDPGLSPAPLFVTATGGDSTTATGDYKYHIFLGDGTFAVSCAGNSAGSNTVDYMVIAGGGGGSGDGSGGGGAGGYRESPGAASSYTASPLGASPAAALSVPATPYAITVGGGGPAPYPLRGASGSNSIFSSITSAGGGGAGHPPGPADACKAGNSGGSGGGAGTSPAPLATAGAGNTPPVSPPQGQDGRAGAPYPSCSGVGGGGGGAGGSAPATTSALDGTSGIGGVGTTSCITAAPVGRAGGGGGQVSGSGLATNGRPNEGNGGGPFGGGFGSSQSIPTGHVQGTVGTANTGGGGGGGAGNASGRAGGSGTVVIRYKYQ